MSDTFPFLIHKVLEEDLHPELPNRHYSLLVDVGQYEYSDLFEEYGYSGNGPSWGEHIRAILEKNDPELLNHLDEDEEGGTYLVYADSQQSVDRFMALIQPIFADPVKLAAYFSQTDPGDFFE